MALEVVLSPQPDARRLDDAVRDVPQWRRVRGGWRRAPVRLVYENSDTGVAFTIDVGGPARLNVPRTDFYGREAAGVVARLAAGLGSALVVDGPDGPAATDEAGLLATWRTLNEHAHELLPGGEQDAYTTRARADAWWSWQYRLEARKAELRPEAIWLPNLLWVHDRVSGEVLRATVWPQRQAQAVPEVELFLVLEGVEGVPVVVEAGVVVAALADLVEVHETRDGTRVRYVPVASDAECRERLRAATASAPSFDADRYVGLDPAALVDLVDA